MKRSEQLLKLFKKALVEEDPIQASEKFYKVAEDCIKLLAMVNKIQEYERASKEGRWWTDLLGKAANRLERLYGEEVEGIWREALQVHVEGFHEGRLDLEQVRGVAPKIECLLKLTLAKLAETS